MFYYFRSLYSYAFLHVHTGTHVVIERRNPTMRSLHNPDIANLIQQSITRYDIIFK